MIEVEHVTKRYRQYRDQAMLLARLLRPHRARQRADLVALDDVSFTLEPGSTLGVIGRNGSGKTTLLRLLSGVSAPTEGRLRLDGRIAPLIGIGIGFNQELTGRENVLVNGRLLGMTAGEVRERFDRIVDFAELREFIDVPVKFYSSGMFLRLGFSVAIHTEPDVMLVDEILAVGDIGFQSKCFDRMRELQDRGTTIVVVTHNMQVLERLTPRTIVLDRGRVVHDGETREAVHRYHELMQQGPDALPFLPAELGRLAERPVATVRATIVDRDDRPVLQTHAADGLRIKVTATFDSPVTAPIVALGIERTGLGLLCAAASDPGEYRADHGPGQPLDAEIEIGSLPLLSGSYTLRVLVHSSASDRAIGVAAPVLFSLVSDGRGSGTVDLDPRFRIGGVAIGQARPRLGGSPDRGAPDRWFGDHVDERSADPGPADGLPDLTRPERPETPPSRTDVAATRRDEPSLRRRDEPGAG